MIFKGCVRYIFTSLFLSLNGSTCQTRKIFFILRQNICSLSRNSKFRILDIQISWRHQMPKHKTRNTFYWIMWKVNSLLMKYGQFISYYKRRYLIKKLHKNCVLKTSSRPFCVSKKLSTSIGKWIFETSYLY